MNSKLYVKITKKGKDPIQFIKEVSRKIHFELQNEIKLSADATAEIMKRIIMASGYKLNRLADAINAEIIDSVGGINIGIGKISDLPKTKDGKEIWELFDSGFKPGASMNFVPLGAFPDGAPDSSKSGGKWNVGAGNYTFFDDNNNKKAVEPLRFVDIGYEDLIKHIERQIDKFLKSLK